MENQKTIIPKIDAAINERADEFGEREYFSDQFEKERIAFGYYHGAVEEREKVWEDVSDYLENNWGKFFKKRSDMKILKGYLRYVILNIKDE